MPPGRWSSPPTRADDLGEPLAVVLDEADRALDDRDRAAVVDLEVDASKAGQGRIELEDAPDVGQAPAVDRLVIIPYEEHLVRGRRQEQRESKLGSIDVLHLVNEEMRAA